jgi:hypothetical protein
MPLSRKARWDIQPSEVIRDYSHIRRRENTMSEVPTTKILAIGSMTAKATPEAIAPVLPFEVRDTVRNYLAGKIEQWFFQTEGYGVVFIMNATSTAEAHDILEKLPLGVAGMMKFDLIAIGPLAPLAMLIGAPPPRDPRFSGER